MKFVNCPECTAQTVQEDLDFNEGVCAECNPASYEEGVTEEKW